MMAYRHLAIVLVVVASALTSSGQTSAADASRAREIVSQYCLDCHDESAAEGDLVLSLDQTDWADPHQYQEWETVYQMVSRGVMPPADGETLSDDEKSTLLDWLDESLIKHGRIGGTPLRRLSRREYANTVKRLFGIDDFELPLSFPPDNEAHGFDNQGEALVVAASHLEAFADTAALIADQLFPPEREKPAVGRYAIPPEDLVISYSSACLIDGAMRLASSGTNAVRHATWPTKFEAPISGTYRIRITASGFCGPNAAAGHVPELRVQTSGTTGPRVTKEERFPVPEGGRETFECVIGIDAGKTVQLWYSNGDLNYDDKSNYGDFLKQLFLREPKLAAAWKQVGNPARGGNGWTRVKEAMAEDDLDDTPFRTEGKPLDDLVKQVAKNAVGSGETIVYKFFEQGPYVAIHQVEIAGPLEAYDDARTLRETRRREQFLAKLRGQSDAAALREFFTAFLSEAFRRPATEREVERFVELVRAEASGSLDRGLHLAVRTALISPAFLYRSIGEGELTTFELASRLAYFLTSSPPDQTLTELASSGKLNRDKTLRAQTRRLLKQSSRVLSTDFATQWLDLEAVERLMPDSRLIRRFQPDHRNGMRDEAIETFHHILSNNLPVRDFIDPDYVFTNALVAKDIYGFPSKGKAKLKKGLQRLEIERGGRRGGLLCMPAVMMATANGVDTQPVLRGVWLLDNILGSPPPEPPKAVPALTPDTRGASTPRERLAAHMSSESCASCHREIDPLGFVLETFDPIGRWREHYPLYDRESGNRKDGAEIDPSGQLPQGVPLADVTDLKRWLGDSPEPFARCLCEKLLTYATGRPLNYRERSIVAQIVRDHQQRGLHLADLLEDLVISDVFRTK